jgi:signal transduction histidine kinase
MVAITEATRGRIVTEAAAVEAPVSAVSWGAIVGGAAMIAATALILLSLGAGFGLSSISPWPSESAAPKTFAVMAGIWLIIVQWVSAGIGGYVSGRLRSRWTALHTQEVAFRDTAHGIIAWALAAIVTAAFLASAISSIIGGAAHEVTAVAAASTQGAAPVAGSDLTSPSGYLVDTLFRPQRPEANINPQDARAEATRVLANGLRNGDVPPQDKAYLGQLVSARTGLGQPDAQKRVDDTIAKVSQAKEQAREAAEAARKAGRNLAFFSAFSMLIGAFIAGVAAKMGGEHRDALI